MNTKKSSLLLIIINFFFVVVAVLILFNFFPKNLFQKKSETYNPMIERIEISIPAEGIVAKQEIIYKAPISGKIKRIKQAPELLPKNEEAVQILGIDTKNALSIKVNDEGFITYIKDGGEDYFSFEKLDNKVLTEDELLNPKVNQVKVSDDQVVEKGDFIFKIVKANFIRFYLVVDTKEIAKFVVGDSLIFSIKEPQNITTDGKIIKIKPLTEKKSMLVFETSFDIELLINYRKITGSFTFPYVTASKIPPKSVNVKKDSKGVDHYYVLIKEEKDNKQMAVLTEIKVLGQNSYTKEYIVNNLSESKAIFRDFTEASKKYINSGK